MYINYDNKIGYYIDRYYSIVVLQHTVNMEDESSNLSSTFFAINTTIKHIIYKLYYFNILLPYILYK